MLGTSSVHSSGLYPVRVAKLNEMPILPLSTLQYSDREEDHHYVHYNFEVKKSFRRDKDKHCDSRQQGNHRRPAHMAKDVRRQIT